MRRGLICSYRPRATPLRRAITVSLSHELHAVVERMLASGRYSNFSEVVRAGLRLLDERELDFQEQRASRSPYPPPFDAPEPTRT